MTGIGIVSALGATREDTWQQMLDGACGVRPVTVFDVAGYRSQVAGEVPMDRVHARGTALQRRRLSRADQIGLMAADEALDDAALLDSPFDRSRVGVMLGAGTADLIRNEG